MHLAPIVFSLWMPWLTVISTAALVLAIGNTPWTCGVGYLAVGLYGAQVLGFSVHALHNPALLGLDRVGWALALLVLQAPLVGLYAHWHLRPASPEGDAPRARPSTSPTTPVRAATSVDALQPAPLLQELSLDQADASEESATLLLDPARDAGKALDRLDRVLKLHGPEALVDDRELSAALHTAHEALVDGLSHVGDEISAQSVTARALHLMRRNLAHDLEDADHDVIERGLKAHEDARSALKKRQARYRTTLLELALHAGRIARTRTA